ncbi:MAG: sensor histidine kinase [Chloroflexi bacterium]|nr:sensor histidine kinase [Chloroflexota bacterium]
MADEPDDKLLAEILQSISDDLQGRLDYLRGAAAKVERLKQQDEDDLRQLQRLISEVSAVSAPPKVAALGLESDNIPGGWIAPEKELRARAAAADCSIARADQLLEKLRLLSNQMEVSIAYMEGDESVHVTDPWEAALRARMIQGQEEERSRLAREIHDGPAQVLANAIMGLDFCEELAKRGSPNLPDELAKLRVGMREGLGELRHFIFNLRPTSLQELGLIGTLCRYIEDYEERFGIQVSLRNAQLAERLPHEQEIVLFRVVQEALQNVRKHANASQVIVAIDRPDPHTLNVCVTDNGDGFDYTNIAQRNGPFGLVSMRERAESIGGKIRIKSSPGRGTEVALSIPYSRG